MSRRFKIFSLVSLFGALVMIVVFITFFDTLVRERLHHSQHLNSVIAANTLVNALQQDGLLDFMRVFARTDPAVLQHPPVMQQIDHLVRNYIKGSSVYKIKIYMSDGLVIYSTDKNEIGGRHGMDEDFKEALAGKVHGELVRKGGFNIGDRKYAPKDVYETYVPVENRDGVVELVFEVYIDATEAVAQMDRSRKLTLLGVPLVVFFFYTALVLLFHRTDRMLQRESRSRELLLQQLNDANEDLEEKVRIRTDELEEARYYLQSVLDGVADPVMVIGNDLKLMDMNAAARALLPKGASVADYPYCYQLSHRRTRPCDGGDHPCSFKAVIETGGTANLLHRHHASDGSPIYMAITTTPLYNREGEMLGVIEVEHDVTEIVQANERLQRSEQYIRTMMDTVADAVLGIFPSCHIRQINQSACRLFGYPAEELEGRHVSDLFGKAPGLEDRDFPDYLESRAFQGAIEIEARRRDGSCFPAELWVGHMEVQGEREMILVIHDISRQKARQRELEQTRQQAFHQEKMAAIGQLAAGILHEVGNPIAAISGILQSMRWAEGGDCDEVFRESLTMIESNVNRLASITREIADFASPRPAERQLLDLNALIRSTVNLMRYDRRFRRIEFLLDLDPKLPAVKAVADQVTQVFMNLFINAMDAYQQQGTAEQAIRVTTLLEEGYIHVTVADRGKGMDGETRYRAMDTFFSTKPSGKGTGLGLPLCDTVMASHGGRLELESEPGEGTTIHLFFPLEEINL